MPSKRIAIAGLGEIGKTVARKLAQGLPGLALAAITTRDRAKAQAWLDREGISCPLRYRMSWAITWSLAKPVTFEMSSTAPTEILFSPGSISSVSE